MIAKYGTVYKIKRYHEDLSALYIGYYETRKDHPQHMVLIRNPKTNEIEALSGPCNMFFEGQTLDSFRKFDLNENEETLAKEIMQKRGL